MTRQRKWQLKMKREGRCIGCGQKVETGWTYCAKCRSKRAARKKRNRARIHIGTSPVPDGYGK